MKFTIRTFIWTSILLALIMAAVFAFVPKPVTVEVFAVAEGPLRVSVREDGKTRIREKYIVSAPVAGRLSRIGLHAGDEICCEETLLAVILPSDPAMLDARSQTQAKAQVSAAEAALKRAKATVEQARIKQDLSKTNFARAEKLHSQQGISRIEFDNDKAAYLASIQELNSAQFGTDIAEFELEMARAAVKQFNGDEKEAMEPFEVRSPVSGKVLRVFQESAQVVNVGTPLMELGDIANLEIEIDVLSTDAVRIEPGAELTVDHWGGESPLQGRVRVIEPAAFTKISSLGVEEQRVNIIADFSESAQRIATLGDGYRVEARITVTEIANATLVPNSSLFRHKRQWHVLKVEDSIAVLQPIEIGRQNETDTQVLKGLTVGDQVIVYPSDEVSSGTRVRY